ncbi:hypothetical protein [Bradyrhizobium sp. ARR65]|uniref:hypothetical protein n=1 Tax=Bradyrhizobium sp. ARR65 TaxID=1040989 RepID=UPI000463686D|nr:hypothetical protein [Bradyrhizobium sp. ARR65]
MVRTVWRTAILGFLLLFATCSEGSAAYVGDRFFPSTLATTVPTPADFYNPPNFVRLPDTATTPTTHEIDIPTTYERLVTRDLGVFFTETFRIVSDVNRGTRTGFDNLVIGAQYQLYTNPEHQFVVSVGGTAAIGGTGSSLAAPFSTLTPTIFIGKGFGDLPDSVAWLRPLTITGTAAVAVPTESSTSASLGTIDSRRADAGAFTSLTPVFTGATTLSETIYPKILQLGFALEYSLVSNEYTGPNRTGTRYPEGWVPLVEFTTQTPLNGPLAGRTTGTVNPGVIWVSRYLQVAAEAIIPIDAHSGRDVGARIQAHLYLPAIFPDLKPMFGN